MPISAAQQSESLTHIPPFSHHFPAWSFQETGSLFCLFAISWAAPAAHGGSQARGLIGAVATGLRQSHGKVGSEPRLRPTPQPRATPDR